MQTTATFDPHTQEFIFNTPTIQAAKFWPGGLGKSTTHAIIYARLITQGKDHGVNAFLVHLRDMETHKALPGIEVGDIGPKMAFIATDNGYLKFTHFRQPRDSLLSRYVTVANDGTLTKDPNSTKMAYGGMLNLRINLHYICHYYIAKMATIAARYSFLRRQFESKEGA